MNDLFIGIHVGGQVYNPEEAVKIRDEINAQLLQYQRLVQLMSNDSPVSSEPVRLVESEHCSSDPEASDTSSQEGSTAP